MKHRKPCLHVIVHRVLLVVLGLLAAAGQAQEPVNALLERGYVAHWLVCGPFSPDVDGGILAAAISGDAALGATDPMAPVGGAQGVRPQHLLTVKLPGGDAVWQRAGTERDTLDLGPFFPTANEGIAYAAFYVESVETRFALLDIQSPLGVRIWVNGHPTKDIDAGTLNSRGVDRVVAAFVPGLNLVLLEVPGLRLDALAERMGVAKTALWSDHFATRTRLDGASGFAISLRVQPAQALGALYFMPTLEPKGTFSGTQNDVRQDMQLALINPTATPSPPVNIQLRMPDGGDPIPVTVPPLKPWEYLVTTLPVPIGRVAAATDLNVTVLLAAEGASTTFKSTVRVAARDAAASVEAVTGPFYLPPGENQADRTAASNTAMAAEYALQARIPEYGFNLGTVDQWEPALVAHPALLGPLRSALVQERVAALPQYSTLDERLVHGELLTQNLRYGIEGAAAQWADLRQSPILLGVPAVAPQTPQVLAHAELAGLLTDVNADGLPGLYRGAAPGGALLPVRHFPNPPAPASTGSLRDAAAAGQAAITGLNLNRDVLPLRNAVAPPEPFMETAATALAKAFPAVRLDGGGAFRFFQSLAPALPDLAGAVPMSSRRLTDGPWGDLLARPDLLEAHARATERTLQAGTFATMAALLGADYPEPALDTAWRQLLHWAGVGRMGAGATAGNHMDALAGLHDAAAWSDTVLRKSLEYIVSEADTLGLAPGETEGVQALTVFNPSSWLRNDVVRAEVRFPAATGLSVLDDTRTGVPIYADRLQYNERRQLVGARVHFVAQAVPGVGYRTYYLVPKGALPQPAFTTDPQIQNEQWTMLFDPETGDIAQWIDKATQVDYAVGGLNRIVGLRQDAAKTQGGRDLWTNGERVSTGGKPDFQTTTLPWMEQITITTPFGAGKLVREVTLYQGIPHAVCVARIEPRALPEATLYGLQCAADPGGSPTVGERFAAQSIARSRDTLVFRSQAGANLSASALQPAWEWMACGPGDGMRIGADRWLPLRPTLITHGPAFKGVAENLLQALTRRGVPVTLWPTAPDVTALPGLPDPNDDLRRGEGFRVVLGVAGQDAYLDALLKRLPAEAQSYIKDRLEAGVAALVQDTMVPDGFPPLPVLVFTANEQAAAVRLAEAAARDWGQSGIYTLAPSAAFATDLPAPGRRGVAVLFSGAHLASQERDNTLFLALGVTPLAAPDVLPAPTAGMHEWQYALLPYAGDWREARIPAAAGAFNAPLLTAQGTLHSGRHPGVQRLLGIDSERFLLTSVRPTGAGRAAFAQRPPNPNDGVVVQGYESTGRPWNGVLSAFRPLRDASPTGLLGKAGAGIPVQEATVALGTEGFGIGTWWLLPDTKFVHGDPLPLAGSTDPGGAVHTAWWEQRSGAAPVGNLPLALTLIRDPAATERVVLQVANLSTDARLAGTVAVTAGQGWTLGPGELPYDLAPGALQETAIRIAPLGDGGSPLRLCAEATVQGQTYRAILGDPPPVLVNVTRTLAQIKVQLTNDGTAPAVGYLDLVTAPAYWPELGGAGRVGVGPRRAAVTVEPGRTQDILFRLSDPDAPLQAVAKLAVEGSVTYHAVPGLPPPAPRDRQPEAPPKR